MRVRRKIQFIQVNNEKLLLAFMAIPPLVCFLIFAYGPIFGWIYAFTDYSIGLPMSQTHFVGFKFFRVALSDPDLIRVIVNTLVLSLLSLLGLPLAMMFAILLSELKSPLYRKIVQTLTTLPNFISWVLVFSICFAFFSSDGLVNQLLFGHQGAQSFRPLEDSSHVWIYQTLIKFWKELGYSAIIFFAGIAGIDGELYDAANVDGAGRWGSIKHITIPGLMPITITLLLISIGAVLSNGFDQYFVFYNPLVADKIEVLDYYVYKIGLKTNDIPYSTALSVFKTVISVILVFTSNFLAKKIRGQSII